MAAVRRLVEIKLRTGIQHEWAVGVEELGSGTARLSSRAKVLRRC
jgi:hypothetical protein